MPTESDKHKRLHYDLQNVGLRAQATAVGLVQLCIELRRANVIDEPALDRIKGAITNEIAVTMPRTVVREAQRREIRARLDRLFSGQEGMGSADVLAMQAPPQ